MLRSLSDSLTVKLVLVPTLSVLLAFLSACSHTVETGRTEDALAVPALNALATDLQAVYADAGLEEVFLYAQADARVTDIVEHLRDAGLQSDIDLIHRAAYEGRVPIAQIMELGDPAMDPEIEAAFSRLHNTLAATPYYDAAIAEGDIGASSAPLVWWAILIVIVIAVAVVAALYSYACARICMMVCAPPQHVVSCMGGSVSASSKSAAIGLCNPVCGTTPPPPAPPPAPPVVVPPPPCPEPSTSQNTARCDGQRAACRATGGVPVAGSAARCNCTVHCIPAPRTPEPGGSVESREPEDR